MFSVYHRQAQLQLVLQAAPTGELFKEAVALPQKGDSFEGYLLSSKSTCVLP